MIVQYYLKVRDLKGIIFQQFSDVRLYNSFFQPSNRLGRNGQPRAINFEFSGTGLTAVFCLPETKTYEELTTALSEIGKFVKLWHLWWVFDRTSVTLEKLSLL